MSAILSLIASLKGYRTLVVNTIVMVTALLAGFGVIHFTAPTADVVGANYDAITGWLTAGVAAVNMVLRLFTTGPVTTKL